MDNQRLAHFSTWVAALSVAMAMASPGARAQAASDYAGQRYESGHMRAVEPPFMPEPFMASNLAPQSKSANAAARDALLREDGRGPAIPIRHGLNKPRHAPTTPHADREGRKAPR